MVSVVDGSMIAVWVFTESACSWADSWGTGGAAQKWWMLCLPWLSACSVEGEGRGRGGEGRGRGGGVGVGEQRRYQGTPLLYTMLTTLTMHGV